MKDDHVAILLEHIEGKLDAFAEAMGHVPTTLQNVDERLERVENDVKAIKAAVKDQGQELNTHEQRITSLETV